MAQIIVLIVLILSFLGMLVIFIRKLPVLVTLPVKAKISKKSLLSKLKTKILEIRPLKSFSFELFLQKVLSKVRVLTLKIEHKTANQLQQLREKSKRKKEAENDNYWEKFKKPGTKANKDSPT